MKDVDEFRARASSRYGLRGQARRAARAVPPSFTNEPTHADYLDWLLERFRDYHVAVELRHRSWSDDPQPTFELLEHIRRRVDADRRAQVPLLDSPGLRRTAGILLHAAPRAQRRGVVATRRRRRPLQLPLLRRKNWCRSPSSESQRRAGREEGLPLHEQPLLGPVGGQRRDAEDSSASRSRRMSAGTRRAVSRADGPRSGRSAGPRSCSDGHPSDHVAHLELLSHVHPRDDLAEHGVSARRATASASVT